MATFPRLPTFDEMPPGNEGIWTGISHAVYQQQEDIRKEEFRCLPISYHPYLRAQGDLNRQEMDGFSAAGILFWRNGQAGIDVLMTCEDIWKKWSDDGPVGTPKRVLNFLGGKRDSRAETPVEVAIRKAMQESGDIFGARLQEQAKNLSYVAWIPKSKYCLFFHEITDERDFDVDRRFNELPRPQFGGPIPDAPAMVALMWVPLAALLNATHSMTPAPLEHFMRSTFRTLDSIGFFRIAIPTQLGRNPGAGGAGGQGRVRIGSGMQGDAVGAVESGGEVLNRASAQALAAAAAATLRWQSEFCRPLSIFATARFIT
jgi:hypothetical protein